MTTRLRIAVADDELDMRDYFARILPRLGHEVVCVAENGRQLVEYCRNSLPDLVVTDIRMPEMDGIEAAGAINSRQSIPVILVSAFHDAQLVQRAENDYVLAYLVKPIKQADLQTAIAITMRRFEQIIAERQTAGADVPGTDTVAPSDAPARGDAQREARETARGGGDSA